MPDETFAKAEAQAHALGVSRSEFVTRAIQHYLDDLEKGSLTRQIDAALDVIHIDASRRFAVEVSHRLLDLGEEEDW
jgi:metal-responsive CopG/Arc/MetJ family transcriptional regulator